MNDYRARYAASFAAYLRRPGEDSLHAAYELGREAVESGLSVMDLAIAHHAALRAELTEEPSEGTVRAAEDFFLESVAAFEMVQRGFRDVRDNAAVQRHHVEMLQQLSVFLADASLALQASDSLDEILQLVCEQGRELASAACCMVTSGPAPQARPRATSFPEDDLKWKAFTAWMDLSHADRLVRESAGPLRIPPDRVRHLCDRYGTQSAERPDAGEWLGVPLRALDGRGLGALHLVNRGSRRFTALDEARSSHLGHLAAAAIERARLYQRPR